MLKREAYTSPKLPDLATRLNIQTPHALGLLACLWNWAADHAFQGDVGKWPNAVIASGCQWHADPEELVSALVASKWLDECQLRRLVIHDLEHHAPRWWQIKVKKMAGGVFYVANQQQQTPQSIDSNSIEPSIEASTEGVVERSIRVGSCRVLSHSGQQSAPQPRRRRPSGVLADISEETLSDTGKLLAWYERASTGPRAILPHNDATRLNVTSTAVMALEAGDKPAALFVSVVKGQEWGRVSGHHESKAIARLKLYYHETGTANSTARTLAESCAKGAL